MSTSAGRGVDQSEVGDRRTSVWRSIAWLIIVITGLFHFGRGAPADGAIFLGVAALVAGAELVDRKNPQQPQPTRPSIGARHSLTRVTGVLGGCLVAGWLVGHWRPGSWPVAVAVAIPGGVVLAMALLAGGRTTNTQPTRRGWWSWAVMGVLICVWELVAFLQQPSPAVGSFDHPTLSVILDPLFVSAVSRSLLLAGWLLAGWWLVRLLLTAADLRGRR